MTPIVPSFQTLAIADELEKALKWLLAYFPAPLNEIAKSLVLEDSYQGPNQSPKTPCSFGHGALFRCQLKNHPVSFEFFVPEKSSVEMTSEPNGKVEPTPHLKQGVVTFLQISGKW